MKNWMAPWGYLDWNGSNVFIQEIIFFNHDFSFDISKTRLVIDVLKLYYLRMLIEHLFLFLLFIFEQHITQFFLTNKVYRLLASGLVLSVLHLDSILHGYYDIQSFVAPHLSSYSCSPNLHVTHFLYHPQLRCMTNREKLKIELGVFEKFMSKIYWYIRKSNNPIIMSFAGIMTINFNMFRSFMKDFILSNSNCTYIINM